MYEVTKTYEDFLGKERTETFYFHLTEADTMKWVTTDGDYTLDQLIQRLIDSNNGEEIMRIMEDLMDRSYGVLSLDGRQFVKNDQVLAEFKATAAYSEIFTEFVTNGEAASKFIAGIIPKKLEKEITKMMAESPESVPEELKRIFNPPAQNTVVSMS